MLKRMNTIFFGICFVTALLLEIYCIYKYNGDLFTCVGIGIVVLITAYLLFDSIRSNWMDCYTKIDSELELHNKEMEAKLEDALSQLLTIQKATYAATKKNSQLLQERILNSSMGRNDQAHEYHGELLNTIINLQKKSMEGQKNALNYEINYNKENLKNLLLAFQEESNKLQLQQEEISNMIFQLEKKIASGMADTAESRQPYTETKTSEEKSEYKKQPDVIPLYDDPNKNLTPEEISTLFSTYGEG